MKFVSCIHHPIEQPSITVGQFAVDIQISNLLAISELRQTAVDPADERKERHIVVPWEDPRDYDCRCGRLLLNLMQNRLKTSSNVDRKSTRLNSSHLVISYAVFCLKKKN